MNVECPVHFYTNELRAKEEVGLRGVETMGPSSSEAEIGVWSIIKDNLKTTAHKSIPVIRNTPATIQNALQTCIRKYRWWYPFAALFAPLVGMGYAMYLINRLIGDHDDSVIKEGAKQDPTFYAGTVTSSEEILAGVSGMFTATIFGGIHCVAQSFEFPSHMEQLLWRIASLAITCLPVIFIAIFFLSVLTEDKVPEWVTYVIVVRVINPILFGLYVISRFVLLVLPFMALRSLPPDAYKTVEWTTFIPHV